MVTDFLADEVWSRPNPDLGTRSLITIAALTASGLPDGLRLNIEMALNNEATRGEIVETILHMASYEGIPLCWDALAIADEVFSQERASHA
jgi:4-carboxymuconolactone decarboxylase